MKTPRDVPRYDDITAVVLQYNRKATHFLVAKGDRTLCGHQFSLRRSVSGVHDGKVGDVNCKTCLRSFDLIMQTPSRMPKRMIMGLAKHPLALERERS